MSQKDKNTNGKTFFKYNPKKIQQQHKQKPSQINGKTTQQT